MKTFHKIIGLLILILLFAAYIGIVYIIIKTIGPIRCLIGFLSFVVVAFFFAIVEIIIEFIKLQKK